ncbi:MAG: hypothetical protein K6L76_02725 [Agarilytica sp.]
MLNKLGFKIFYDIDDEVVLSEKKIKAFNAFLSGVSAAYPDYPRQLGLEHPVCFYPTPLDENIQSNQEWISKDKKYTFAWIGTYVTYRTQVRTLVENISPDQTIKIITGKLSDVNHAEIESLSPNVSVVAITDWLDTDRVMQELQEATFGLHMSRHRERAGGMSYKVVHYIQAGLIPIEIGERDPALVNICSEFSLKTLVLENAEALGGVLDIGENKYNDMSKGNTKNIEKMRVANYVKPLLEFWIEER